MTVDFDPDRVAIDQLADRSAGEGLWADVPDASAGRYSGKSGIGDEGDVFAKREVAQG